MIRRLSTGWPLRLLRGPARRALALLTAVALASCLPLPGGSSPNAGVEQTAEAGDVQVTLRVDDDTLGTRVLDVDLRTPAGEPVEAQSVQLRFSMVEMDMGDIRAEAQPVDRGRYRAEGPYFSMVGRWTVEVTVDRAGQEPVVVPFELAIAAPGEASGPLNPLAADAATLAAGEQIYQANCAVCHGATGRGDGPGAVGLNPRPGDLTLHMLPGKHTDGQVFLWIRDGYPGTAMPAWRDRLSEEQIWQVVTYLRTFGQPAAAAPDGTAAPTATAAAPQATPAAETGESLPPLLFVRGGQIWRSDGTAALQPVTRLPDDAYAQFPQLSPDGSRIAFVTTSQGPLPEDASLPLAAPKTVLYAMDAEGGEPQPLWEPERGVLGRPAWSPDGRAIYVGFFDIVSQPGAPVNERVLQVVRVDAETGAREVAFENVYDLSFSRDGQRVVFLRWHADLAAFTLNVAQADGSDEREVVGWSRFSELAAPRLSPDGSLILFTATGGPPTDERGFPISAGRSLSEGLLAALAPPVAAAHAAPQDIWIVNVDGSGLRRLTSILEDSPLADFSPDGTQVAVMGGGGIYVLNADGSDLRKVDPLGDHGGLDWVEQ